MEVVIRTMDQIHKMGDTGNAILTMASHNVFEGNTYNLVYQFKKGIPGESKNPSPWDIIGTVKNVTLTEDGLVGDVTINVPVKNARHFDGAIDNLVITVDVPGDKFDAYMKKDKKVLSSDIFRLEHFVVYNKDAKKMKQLEKNTERNVQKMYNAPKEVLDSDMSSGEELAKNIENWDKIKDEATNQHDFSHPHFKPVTIWKETNQTAPWEDK